MAPQRGAIPCYSFKSAKSAGRGDRVSDPPVDQITVVRDLLAFLWSYPMLVVATVGLGTMNYPVWGLVAAVSNGRFPPDIAVRAVSLGLVAAAGFAAAGNAVTGAWIDATGSMRVPIIVLAVVTSALGVWVGALYRIGVSRSVESAVPSREDA